MAEKVIFTVTKGAAAGKEFSFEGSNRIYIGRADDCGIVLPENTVSRYHCVLLMTPPDIKLQDFGSLNGTFLNGEKIGQRGRTDRPGEKVPDFPEFPLKNGDVLGLGTKCELTCRIEETELCADCGAPLPPAAEEGMTVPEDGQTQPVFKRNDGKRICLSCYQKQQKEKKAAEEAEAERLRAEKKARAAAEKARKEAEAAEAKRREAEKEKERLLAEKARKEAELAEKARKEAERQLEEMLAAQEQKQRKCAGCHKMFTPTEPGNNLCPDCLKNKDKILDGILAEMLENAQPPTPANPAILEGFDKVCQLGKGGMGEVWKVREKKTGKLYALKTMLPDVAADSHSRDLFLREASIMEYLDHKNTVRAYRTGCVNDVFYILMDLCEGGSVDSLMEKKGGKLSIELATWIILQSLTGLSYAHSVAIDVKVKGRLFEKEHFEHVNGVVHRDFKPGNIFLCDTSDKPLIKVADFGMAKAFETAGKSGMTGLGNVMGTPVFMCRQQATDCRFSKPQVDVWAAAASYYNMLTGQFPKQFTPDVNPLQVIVRGTAVPIRNRNPKIPAEMAAVIDRALEDQNGLKYETADAFRRDLIKALPAEVKAYCKGIL